MRCFPELSGAQTLFSERGMRTGVGATQLPTLLDCVFFVFVFFATLAANKKMSKCTHTHMKAGGVSSCIWG